jgi:hypothetical protein
VSRRRNSRAKAAAARGSIFVSVIGFAPEDIDKC